MAARKNPKNPPQSYELQRAKQLLNRLNSFVNGEVELTTAQVQAAKVVIGKEIGDIAVQKVSVEGPVQLEIVHRIS